MASSSAKGGLTIAKSAAERLHAFGVRHHGPGCARSLLGALDALDPEMVLIEGPADASPLLTFAARPGLVPPVALLLYAERSPEHAVFYPFADWSPEWQAMQWAARRDRPIRFIDLPAQHKLAALVAAEAEVSQREGAESSADDRETGDASTTTPAETAEDRVASMIRADPIGVMAQLAGQDDGEAWWNQLIEEQTHAPALFGAVEAAMAALRAAVPERSGPDDDREAQREAHMRLACAKALKETTGPIGVVVGAWHVPALRAAAKTKDDRALLKGLPKEKTTATWVPWTFTRLARGSGYGAGVDAPGWYAHLWEAGQQRSRPRVEAIVTGWLVKAARLLRAEGLDASTASVIEAQRLAFALAAMNDVGLPGLELLTDAVRTTMCGGESKPLELIERRLYVGATVGAVGPDVPQNPLAEDLTRQQRAARLKPEALERDLSLDLRSDSGLRRSTLLHRLQLIGVPWGTLQSAGRSRGTFRENWRLRWDPEFSVALAEALVFGTTVEAAASGKALSKATENTAIQELADTVQACLLADLDDAARQCIQRLQAKATAGAEVIGLMGAAIPLASVLRYGTARRMPEEALSLLVTSLVEQTVVGLVHACRRLDDETAAHMQSTLTEFDRALVSLDREVFVDDLDRAFRRIAEDDQATPLLAGFAVRKLHDRGRFEPRQVEGFVARALSPSIAPTNASAWLEGFLARSGSILVYDEILLGLIDAWVLGLAEDIMVAQLPMLRRAFSTLEEADRRLIIGRLRHGGGASASAATQTSRNGDDRFFEALPLLQKILGAKLDEGDRP